GAVNERRGALGRQRRQPAVFGAEHPVGRDQRQRSSPGSLAEDERDRRGVEIGQFGQAAGDLAGDAALLGGLGQRRTGGVDDGDQRQMQFGGQAHPAAGLTQRRRTQGGPGVLPEPVLAEDDARRGPELRQGQQQPGVLLPL